MILTISNLTRGNMLDKGYGPKKTSTNSLTLGDKELIKFFN